MLLILVLSLVVLNGIQSVDLLKYKVVNLNLGGGLVGSYHYNIWRLYSPSSVTVLIDVWFLSHFTPPQVLFCLLAGHFASSICGVDCCDLQLTDKIWSITLSVCLYWGTSCLFQTTFSIFLGLFGILILFSSSFCLLQLYVVCKCITSSKALMKWLYAISLSKTS